MVIDLDFDFMGGADAAADHVRHLIGDAIREVGSDPTQGIVEERTRRGGACNLLRRFGLAVAPIGFGDSVAGDPVVGTIPALVEHLAAGQLEGRMFSHVAEAVVGAASPFAIGDTFQASHGQGRKLKPATIIRRSSAWSAACRRPGRLGTAPF